MSEEENSTNRVGDSPSLTLDIGSRLSVNAAFDLKRMLFLLLASAQRVFYAPVNEYRRIIFYSGVRLAVGAHFAV